MKTVTLIVLSFALTLFSSCDKDTGNGVAETDYLIFGDFYGECIGPNCVNTYKLTDTKLYMDLQKNYSSTDFRFVRLDQTSFENVYDLKDYFPSDLLDESDDVIGCPDCLDQGGIFISYSNNGVIKTWRIDNSKDAVPAYLHAFMDKVHEKLNYLKQ